MSESEVFNLQNEVNSKDALGLLNWAIKTFAGKLAMATSLGAEDQVLTHLIAVNKLDLPLFTLDTGRLPQETYDVLAATRERYGLRIEVLFPERAAVEALSTEHGPNLFYRSVGDRKQCCQVRKVEPLQRRLAGLDAWVSGLRRDQAVTRGTLQKLEWDAGNGLVKLSPLADWTNEDVWDLIRTNSIPYNKLHDRGYPSIGCAPCTRAVAPGEDIRAGRWWWEDPENKECGLHRRPV